MFRLFHVKVSWTTFKCKIVFEFSSLISQLQVKINSTPLKLILPHPKLKSNIHFATWLNHIFDYGNVSSRVKKLNQHMRSINWTKEISTHIILTRKYEIKHLLWLSKSMNWVSIRYDLANKFFFNFLLTCIVQIYRGGVVCWNQTYFKFSLIFCKILQTSNCLRN